MLLQALLPVLRSFSTDEIKRFNLFLRSPYFNKNKSIVLCYDLIAKYYPTFKSKKLLKELIYKELFNNGTYNDSTMRSLVFRLEVLLNKFLVYESLGRKELLTGNILLSEYNLRKQKLLFQKHLENFETAMNESTGTDYFYYYNKYLLEVNKFNFTTLNSIKPKREDIQYRVHRLDKATLYLSIYYITELICNYLNQAVILKKYNLRDVNSLITKLLKDINIKNILVSIKGRDEHDFILILYYNLLECFLNFNKIEYYYAYKKLVNKYEKKLSRDEITFQYSRLISYCIYKSNLSNSSKEFKNELFEIYKDFLKKEYFKDNKIDFLQYGLYRDILLLALNIGELDWAKNFIDEYSKKVENNLRDEIYSYGNAFYFYYSGELDKAEKYLKEVMKPDFHFRFDAKHLEIAINHERNNLQGVTENIHAYRVLLSEADIMPDELKKKHINYLRYIKKLVSYAYGKGSKRDLDYLKQEILKTDNIIQREWLLNQCDNLLKAREGNRLRAVEM